MTHAERLQPTSVPRTLTQGKTLAVYFCVATLMALAGSRLAHAQNTISTVAGGAAVGGAATAWDIPGPSAVIQDASGNLYIASADSYDVFEVSPSGTISVFAGTGIAGFSGDGGQATKATLSAPAGLAIDSVGNIYIADLNRIREVNTSGVITTIAGNGAICAPSTNTCGDGGLATMAQLDAPQGMAIDTAGDVYIADTQDAKVRLVTKSTGIISTVAGTGKLCDGPTEDCGDHGPAPAAYLDYPTGVVLDSFNDLIFTDTRDQRIRCIIGSTGGCDNPPKATVGDIYTIVGTGQFCDPSSKYHCGDGGAAIKAHLWNPEGLAQDSAGNLYFADQLDCRVRKVNISTWIISTVAGSYPASVSDPFCGFSGDGGSALKASLELPYSVFVNTTGVIYVADAGNQRVREITTSGNTSTIITVAGGGSGGDNGAATQATLADPISVAWDNSGNYYIADTANNRIRKVSAGSNVITTVAGTGDVCVAAPTTGTCGNTNALNVCGDGGPATQAGLWSPNGIAVDASGNIYFSDTLNYTIREVSTSGSISTVAGTPGCQCDPGTDACGDNGPATSAQFTDPTAISLDGLGNLYVADYFGNKVREVNLTTGMMMPTVAGNGTRGHSGNNGLATQALLEHPGGVANDAAGNVYIADSGNSWVRCVLVVADGCDGSQASQGDIIDYAFNGIPGFSGDGGLAVKAETVVPDQVATDVDGNVYSGGGGSSAIRRTDFATHTVDTIAGNPSKSGFGGDGGPATKATLDNDGLSVNASKVLLIADNGNNRIRETAMVPVLTASTEALNFPNTKVGTSSNPLPVTLSNIGADDQTLGQFSIGGPDPGDFSIKADNCSNTALAPDLNCTITVVFTPQATGLRTAFLKVSNLSTRLPLSGTGE